MSATPLFRAEVIKYQRDSVWAGDVIPPPPAAAVLTGLLVATLVALLTFLAFGSYARKEIATGFLTPTLGSARVLPPRTGTVAAIFVTDGKIVAAGDALLTVRVGQTSAAGQDTDAAVLQALTHQHDALLEQIALVRPRATSDMQRLRETIVQLEREIETAKQDLVTQQQRTQLALDAIVSAKGLTDKGLVSVIELKHRQDGWLAQQQNETAMVRTLAQRQSALAQQRNEMATAPGVTAEKISTLMASKADIESRLAEIEGRRAYLLRAPMAGRVSALQARVGGVADPAVPMAVIVPDGDPLQAVLLVGPRAIGFIAPGQLVNLSLDAFPFQHFGFQRGKVLSVSTTLLRPTELVSPIIPRDPVYRVTVALDRQVIDAYGRQVALGADMTLSAAIILDRRSLLQWLLSPLLEARAIIQ
jgi:membrane fusion protein